MLRKHLPSIESWLQKMQLKSAKAKQKLNFDSGFYGTSMVGKAGLGLAGPGLDVAMDQLPSPWPLGAPAGKDICQRESWHLYFLLNLGLFLSHSFMSFLFFFFFCSWSSLYYSKSLSSVNVLLITLSFSRLSLFIHLFPLLICSLYSQILKSLNSPHILSSIVFPLYISE